jgi:hypothetical protein
VARSRAIGLLLALSVASSVAGQGDSPLPEPLGFAADQDTRPEDARAGPVESGDPIRREALQHFMSFGEGVLAALYGSGERRTVTKERNQHAPKQLDLIATEYLAGAEITVMFPGGDRSVMLPLRLNVTRTKLLLPGALAVGKARDSDVRQLLGAPISMRASDLVYHVQTQTGADVLEFRFHGKQRLQEVMWKWNAD